MAASPRRPHGSWSELAQGSSGAVSATAPSPWSRGRSPAPAGRARGSLASGGSWILTQGRGRAMAKADLARTGSTIRCAIYTRKSSDEGLNQEFNSLDAQREACEAYIVSQRHAGWIALIDMYDDGGLSGGTMERPALGQQQGSQLHAELAARFHPRGRREAGRLFAAARRGRYRGRRNGWRRAHEKPAPSPSPRPGSTRALIKMKEGRPAKFDYEYERNGTANLFIMFAPLEG
jgi:Resolvase, N terminal domain